jgi:hypothetical protein
MVATVRSLSVAGPRPVLAPEKASLGRSCTRLIGTRLLGSAAAAKPTDRSCAERRTMPSAHVWMAQEVRCLHAAEAMRTIIPLMT